jgi:hypothetical protein
LHPGRLAATEVRWEVVHRAPVQGLTVVAVGPDARGEDVIMAQEVEWFVGSDWAIETHQVCLVDARGECAGERSVAALGELCDWLIARTGARPEAIALLVRGCLGDPAQR